MSDVSDGHFYPRCSVKPQQQTPEKHTQIEKKKSGKQRDKECFPEAVQEKLHGVTARTQMIKVSKYSQVSALSL